MMEELIPALADWRVSTQDQSDFGYSLPKQREAIERYAREHG
jgi:DNA invertase Pin-like site-specific DNA recombinase